MKLRHRIATWLAPELAAKAEEHTRLAQQCNQLQDRNLDLHTQCVQLRTAKPMTMGQWADVERKMREHTVLLEEQNKIIRWLREHNAADFDRKTFAELSFSDMVIKLLGGK